MIELENKRPPKCIPEIEALSQEKKIDESSIIALCDFVNTREDCSDFRLTTLIRILYDYSGNLEPTTMEALKNTVLNFKYWMDEPGDDSLCIWSENHQLLFASCEFLAGQYYPEEVFTNNQMTGRERMTRAKIRILDWLKDRWDYGFIEWHSNVYYEEDIAPLANLIDLSRDAEMSHKATTIMDLLLLDVALHNWKGYFNVSSGRCYEHQKKEPLQADMVQVSQQLWGDRYNDVRDDTKLSAIFRLMGNYKRPAVIDAIANDRSSVVIKSSTGLNIDELKGRGFDMKSRKTGAFIWAMEAFVHPRIINCSVDNFSQWKMQDNRFIKDLKPLANPIVRHSGLLPVISKILNPVINGVAIQRANTYTYKTADYLLSTACHYHPGDFGDQQHIWNALMSAEINVFTTNPAILYFEGEELLGLSPNNWVGNGRNPHSVQHENIHLSLYVLGKRKGFMEKGINHLSHAHFPKDRFDQVIHRGSRIYGKTGNAYIALIGGSELNFSKDDPYELIQEGKETWWACLMGRSEEDGTFQEFTDRVEKTKTEYKNKTLTLSVPGKERTSKLSLTFKGEFKVDGETQSPDFGRLDSPYAKIERYPEEMKISKGANSIILNFNEQKREQA